MMVRSNAGPEPEPAGLPLDGLGQTVPPFP